MIGFCHNASNTFSKTEYMNNHYFPYHYQHTFIAFIALNFFAIAAPVSSSLSESKGLCRYAFHLYLSHRHQQLTISHSEKYTEIIKCHAKRARKIYISKIYNRLAYLLSVSALFKLTLRKQLFEQQHFEINYP